MGMQKFTVDNSAFQHHFMESLDKALKDAAEPLIKECVEKVERELRERLASKVVSLHSFIRIDMMENNLILTVQLPPNSKEK